MWKALKEIAAREQCSVNDVCSLVDYRKEKDTSLTAAIRVFVMLYYKAATNEEGHKAAGHGNFLKMIERARATDIQARFSSQSRQNESQNYLMQQMPDYGCENRRSH